MKLAAAVSSTSLRTSTGLSGKSCVSITLALLANAVTWATNEPLPVSIKGPGVLDVSVWTQENSMTVHLVNLTNPMMMKGPVREILPIPSQQVRLQIPKDHKVTGVKLLVADHSVPYRRTNAGIELEVPTVALHEVIAVDFG